MQNGLDNGAYNLDKVNDAINEVTTRLVDGTIADSLSKIDEKTGRYKPEPEAGAKKLRMYLNSGSRAELHRKMLLMPL